MAERAKEALHFRTALIGAGVAACHFFASCRPSAPSLPANGELAAISMHHTGEARPNADVSRPKNVSRLDIDVLEPSYRNTIYASQHVSQIVFSVSIPDAIATDVARLDYELTAGNNGPARIGTSFGGTHQLQSMDVESLPLGDYTLSVRASDARSGVLGVGATMFHKVSAPVGDEVRIDEHGNLLINGQPELLIGWYGSIPSRDPRSDVVALQNLTLPVVLSGTPEHWRQAVRDEFAKGVRSVISVEPGALLYTFRWQESRQTLLEEMKTLDAPSDTMQRAVADVVQAVHHEPGLLGYYLADEPEIHGVRPAYLEAEYRLLANLDPYHVAIVTNMYQSGARAYSHAADVFNADLYSPEWDYVSSFFQHESSEIEHGQSTMFTAWTNAEQTFFTKEFGSAPPYPYRVYRNQYLTAFAYGARAFAGFAAPYFLAEPTLRYGLPPIWRELRFLQATALAAAPEEQVKLQPEAGLTAWIRRNEGYLYLIVANHTADRRSVRISHSMLEGTSVLDVMSEGRTVAVAQGTTSDHFDAGDVHVYTTDPRNRELPTTTSVAALIAQYEAEADKPADILSAAHGVLARSSEPNRSIGERFYYYAINGITDDDGWTCTRADRPSWLDLVLPKERRLGRLVIHSENLTDYDLSFVAADNTQRVAQIRGNTNAVTEHTLNPPIRTLRMRLTVLSGKRAGSPDGARIAEIEGYETAGSGTPLQTREFPTASEQPPEPSSPDRTTPMMLWTERLKHVSGSRPDSSTRSPSWSFDPGRLSIEPSSDGHTELRKHEGVSDATLTGDVPTDDIHRFLQLKISGIGHGEYARIAFGNRAGSDSPGLIINTNRIGIYTVDTARSALNSGSGVGRIEIYVTGPTETHTRLTFDWLRLAREPLDGLSVTLAGGAPLPPILKAGQELIYHVLLSRPAAFVGVEALAGPAYQLVALDDAPYVQLVRAGHRDGREWAARVKLGTNMPHVDSRSGYPIVWHAFIRGGGINDTYYSDFVEIE